MSIEAMKQALEALEQWTTPHWAGTGVDKANAAYATLRTAIEQAAVPEAHKKQRFELIGHADLGINNIYIFSGYGEEVPKGRTPIYAGYTAPAAPNVATPRVQEQWLRVVTDKIEAKLLSHRLSLHDEAGCAGNGYPLIDALCCGQKDLEIGKQEIKDIAEVVYHVLAAAQRQWVGLTDEEIFETHKQVDSMQYLTFGKAIEAKLRERNGA